MNRDRSGSSFILHPSSFQRWGGPAASETREQLQPLATSLTRENVPDSEVRVNCRDEKTRGFCGGARDWLDCHDRADSAAGPEIPGQAAQAVPMTCWKVWLSGMGKMGKERDGTTEGGPVTGPPSGEFA